MDIPDGFEYAARVADKRWTTRRPGLYVADRCRFQVGRRGCGEPAKAWLHRGMTGALWAYCADHLYGRWIENGQVMEWHVIETPTPPTEAVPKEEENP